MITSPDYSVNSYFLQLIKNFFGAKSTFFTKGYQTGENCKQKLISKYHKIP